MIGGRFCGGFFCDVLTRCGKRARYGVLVVVGRELFLLFMSGS